MTPGLTDDETKFELFNMICNKLQPNALICEVGVFVGGNIVYLGHQLKHLDKYTVKILAVDNWDCTEISSASKNHVNVQSNFYDAFYRNICAEGVNDLVEPIRKDSIKASWGIKDNSLDFLFLDSNHEYPFVKYELEAWLPKMKTNSIIGGHDWPAPGVQRAVKEVLGETGINITSNSASYWKVLGNGLQ